MKRREGIGQTSGQEFSNTDERCQAKKFENRINTYVCTHTHTHTHTFLRTS